MTGSLCLFVYGTANLFSKVADPFYMASAGHKGSDFVLSDILVRTSLLMSFFVFRMKSLMSVSLTSKLDCKLLRMVIPLSSLYPSQCFLIAYCVPGTTKC